ncbi:MAG TPA: hypothetical protein VKQ72_20120 [Aggregatilineales bacterium]|nr:hypothetical protein [Aggregatilineales bacterium]
MELAFLHIADYANLTKDDKLNIMGIFSVINALNFPTQHPEMHVVAQLAADPGEYSRQFQVTIKLLNEDASQELVNFNAPATVPNGRGLRVTMNFTLRLVNIVFPTPGTYEFVVLVDGDQKGSASLYVNQVQQPSQPAQNDGSPSFGNL